MLKAVMFLMGACCLARAHDVITTKVTWSREISRLVYKRCVSCHREGGSSFSLVHYAEARPWAKAIKEETLERRMPPWGAVKGFGSFRNDQGLTQEDLELISDWVEGGAPEGNPLLLPALPAFDPPKPSRQGREVLVDGSLQFSGPVTLLGLQPKTVQEGKTVQIVAERPDGTVEPLLWLYHYKPQFDHPYLLLRPLTLPAGSKIVCQPPDAGTVSLLTAGVTSARSRAH